jgi:hypothetical protein
MLYPPDPLTAEAARHLLAFKEARGILEEYLEAKASFDKNTTAVLEEIRAIGLGITQTKTDLVEGSDEIRRAIEQANAVVDWDSQFRKLGSEVHDKG